MINRDAVARVKMGYFLELVLARTDGSFGDASGAAFVIGKFTCSAFESGDFASVGFLVFAREATSTLVSSGGAFKEPGEMVKANVSEAPVPK